MVLGGYTLDETARKTLFEILTKDIEVLESVDGLREVETRITGALNYDNRVWQDKELSGVKVRVKNRSSRKNYQKGSIFQIYLEDLKVFTYCIVLEKNESLNLMAFLSSFTKEELTVSKTKNKIYKKEFCMVADSGITGILNGEWKYVFNVTESVLSTEEVQNLEYVYASNRSMLRPDEWYFTKITGDPTSEIFSGQKIDLEEAKKILNPAGSPGQGWIEGFLSYIAEGKTVVDYQMRREG